jgi:hypothetical protein
LGDNGDNVYGLCIALHVEQQMAWRYSQVNVLHETLDGNRMDTPPKTEKS